MTIVGMPDEKLAVPKRSLFGVRRAVISEALWVTAGQAIGAIGSLAGVRILTHALDPVAYGELALGMTAATLGLQVLLAPLTTSTLRFFAPAQEAHDLRGFLAAVRYLLAFTLGIMSAAAALIGAAVVILAGVRWLPLAIGAFVFAVLSGTNSVLDGMQNAARQRLIVAWHDGLAPWLRFGVAILLIAMLRRATSGVAMTGYALGSLAVLGSQFFFFRIRIRALAAAEPAVAENRHRWVREIFGYGWPFALWGVFTWAQLASDRWALGALVSTREVGIYAAIYQIGFYPVLMLSQVLSQLVVPVLFEKAGDATDRERVRASMRLNARLVFTVVGLTITGTAMAFALHGWIARLLLAPSYRTASHFLPWIVLSGGLYATAQMAALFFMLRNESGSLLLPKIISCVLAVGLNFAGARLFGMAGVIGAGLVFGVVYSAWLLLLVARSNAKDASIRPDDFGRPAGC